MVNKYNKNNKNKMNKKKMNLKNNILIELNNLKMKIKY